MAELVKKPLFNPGGDTEVRLRRMIGGNTTNLNDFNNMRYAWGKRLVPAGYEQFLDTGGDKPFAGCEGLPEPFGARAQGLR